MAKTLLTNEQLKIVWDNFEYWAYGKLPVKKCKLHEIPYCRRFKKKIKMLNTALDVIEEGMAGYAQMARFMILRSFLYEYLTGEGITAGYIDTVKALLAESKNREELFACLDKECAYMVEHYQDPTEKLLAC
ncbi:MAG: hypothetical protein ABH829_04875 [archaeon]